MDFMVALPTIVKAMAMGAVPILLAALGEGFSEKAGLVNIGLEGIMAVGAFVAFAVGKVTGNLIVLGDRFVAETFRHVRGKRSEVDLTEIDLVVCLAVLREL